MAGIVERTCFWQILGLHYKQRISHGNMRFTLALELGWEGKKSGPPPDGIPYVFEMGRRAVYRVVPVSARAT